MALQRILLVEDDPLMQRFVSYAIDEERFSMTCCESVPQALDALTRQAYDWILTDLMLPGISGLSLIEQLTESAALKGTAKIVALSAGIDQRIKQQLLSLGVSRQLLKPVSVALLRETLDESTPDGAGSHAPLKAAVEAYFGGDQDLFDKFTLRSYAQLQQDIQQGDRSIEEKDFACLHRLAHSLKSVLLLLGETQIHAQAIHLEQLVIAQNNALNIEASWHILRSQLQQLAPDR